MPPRPQHRWSEEDREIIRRHYRHTRRSCEDLGARFGVSWFALRYQVGVMGIARSGNRRPWSEEEDERLCQLMELYPTSRVARRMHRTINSVVARSKRLGVSRRNRSGWYTKLDVCRICGVSHPWLQRHIDSGALPATYHNGRLPTQHGLAMWHIAQEDLRRFIPQYLQELRDKRGTSGWGGITYRQFRRRFAVHYREALRLGIVVEDGFRQACLRESKGGLET